MGHNHVSYVVYITSNVPQDCTLSLQFCPLAQVYTRDCFLLIAFDMCTVCMTTSCDNNVQSDVD